MANELNPLDKRKGLAFQDPITATGDGSFFFNKHAPGWGVLVTPDEQRYKTLFGNRLQAPDSAQTITDEVLFDYEVTAIGIVERTYQIHIIPRIVLAQGRPNGTTGEMPARDMTQFSVAIQAYYNAMDDVQKENLVEYEPGYAYRRATAEKYLYTKLNRRPVQTIFGANMILPDGSPMQNLLPFMIPKLGLRGSIQFYLAAGATSNVLFMNQVMPRATIPYPFDDFPDAIKVDYLTGWKTARQVPHDLREIVRMLAGIMLMEDYGDGKGGGLAGASASFNSVSESYQTTDSATSGTFGPRVKDFQAELKRLDKVASSYYKRNTLGVLG